MEGKGYGGEAPVKNRELMAKIIAEEGYGLEGGKLENPAQLDSTLKLAYLSSSLLPILPYFMDLPVISASPLSFLCITSFNAHEVLDSDLGGSAD